MTAPDYDLDKIDALVAEHVAGWTPTEEQVETATLSVESIFGETEYRPSVSEAYRLFCPKFSRSADAVMPLLEGYGPGWIVSYNKTRGEYAVALFVEDGDDHEADAPTFPLAACLALLKAKGVTP